MNTIRFSIVAFLLTASVASLHDNAYAGMWDDPKNLKALPEDIAPGDLRATMIGFTRATGSRCSSCHVGKVETDLSTYDFTLDDKAKKLKARAMLLMVKDINSYLTKNLSEYSTELLTVDCATCHRGRAKPEMIQDIVLKKYRDEGLEQAYTEYRSLRQDYYGGYAFDFGPTPLNFLAENIAFAKDYDTALGFLDLNIEFNPDSVRAHQLRGDIWKEKGNITAARSHYQKALELNPDNAWTQQLLRTLDNPDSD